tara:strand:+ start:739 stop:1404 length:666 start_codon:yes stop_codon:yes gene_type:complete
MNDSRYIHFITLCSVFIFYFNACSDDPEINKSDTRNKTREVNKSDSEDVHEVLSEQEVILNEIDVCGNGDTLCIGEPKFFPLHEFKEMSSGFALRFYEPNDSNKRKIWKTFVYIRRGKKLKCINKFQGPIMANDTNKSDFPDLLIRLTEFQTNKRLFYNCWFTYNFDEVVYEFDYCDLIQEKPMTNSMKPILIYDHYTESPKKRKELNDELRMKLKNKGLY